MNKCFNSLTTIHLELTSRCNKDTCWMCGRRKIEKEYPTLMEWGDMLFELVEKIAQEVPDGIIIQFFNNGEGLLYPRFKDAVSLFKNQIKCLNTNGILLVEKAEEIIDVLDTLTVSVVENDLSQNEQYKTVEKFLEIKGNKKPYIIFRLLGNINKFTKPISEKQKEIYIACNSAPPAFYMYDDISRKTRWYNLAKQYNCLIVTRILHDPMGSFNYEKKVTIPEVGFCTDAFSSMAIDRYGKVKICVRFDPHDELVIGDVYTENLVDIWNGEKRLNILKKHIEGKRSELPFCGQKCEFYGVPSGN